MTSKDISFFNNLRIRKEGMAMLEVVKEQLKNKKQPVECVCGGIMEKIETTRKFSFSVADQNRVIDIINAPLHKCTNCGEVVEDLLLYADVEKAIGEEIFIRLNNRQEIPDEINFSEFAN